MDLIEKIKTIWRKSRYIRPAFWALYRLRPTAVYRKKRTDYRMDRVFPSIYLKEAEKPVDPRKVVFFEPKYYEMQSSMKLMYEMVKEDPRFDVTFTCHRQGEVSKERFQFSKKLVKELATAKYIFLSDASRVVGCLPMREETVYVQLWHACGAFKGFGMSTSKKTFGANAKRIRRHPAYANTSMVTVSSPEICWAYAEAMELPEEVIYPVGVSRTDVFFREERIREAFGRIYEKFPAARGKKIILYAPTFRGHVASAVTAKGFRPELFAKELGKDYVVIVKHHPVVKELPQIPEKVRDVYAYDATRTLDIEDLLIAADICITDYSSIIFEYSLMRRPMLFYAYDLKEYDEWRGFYYPYEELTPGPVCSTNEEMIDYIRHLDERFDAAQVDAFRERFMSACDGHATERILEKAVELGKVPQTIGRTQERMK